MLTDNQMVFQGLVSVLQSLAGKASSFWCRGDLLVTGKNRCGEDFVRMNHVD